MDAESIDFTPDMLQNSCAAEVCGIPQLAGTMQVVCESSAGALRELEQRNWNSANQKSE